jgi:hypothetical protein
MADQEQEKTEDQGVLIDAAKAIGSAAGRIAGALGVKGEPPVPDGRTYQAEYVGSGTFTIRKPPRTRKKTRQSQLKNPQRGARR